MGFKATLSGWRLAAIQNQLYIMTCHQWPVPSSIHTSQDVSGTLMGRLTSKVTYVRCFGDLSQFRQLLNKTQQCKFVLFPLWWCAVDKKQHLNLCSSAPQQDVTGTGRADLWQLVRPYVGWTFLIDQQICGLTQPHAPWERAQVQRLTCLMKVYIAPDHHFLYVHNILAPVYSGLFVYIMYSKQSTQYISLALCVCAQL